MGRRIYLSDREARVAADVLQTVSAYTAEELAEHFGWDQADIDAWTSATRKVSS